jgi:ABC-2 type transport system permease protein
VSVGPGTLSHVWRAIPDLSRVALAGVVAYRAEMVIWILSTLLPLVMLALWTAVAQDGPLAGYDQEGFARYFAVTLLVRQLSSVWLVWELNYEIRSGRLSNKLLKPMHPLLQHMIEMLVAVPFRALVMVPILLLMLLLRPDLWQTPSPAALLLFAVSMVLAWLVNFLVQALFATFSFWIDKTDALFGVWFGVWSLLSGYLAPLAVFPDRLKPLLILLPFRGMLGLPVEILGGFVDPVAALPEVAVQVAWVLLLVVATSVTWTRGIARYGAYGA